jgi:hypothetical protein
MRRLVSESYKLIRHVDLASYDQHTTRLKSSLTISADIAKACDEASESCGVDGAHAED